jgi:hypothetical protein
MPRFEGDGSGFTFNEGYHSLLKRGEFEEVAVRNRGAREGIDSRRG